MPRRPLSALALGGVILLSGASVAAGAQASWAAPVAALAAPVADLAGGRHTGPQQVSLSAEPGTEIRYTLDGTRPTRLSPLASGPVEVSRSATLTAVAFTPWAESAPFLAGYVIKTAEKPLAQFAVMSDIHVSSDAPDIVAKWQSYFDALKRIAPNPDAIISNGDQINDNNYNTASDHRYVRGMLEQNLARTGMTGTDVLLSFGNHDDLVDRMAAQYPQAWFPHTGKGYYETKIGGFPAFVVNTEAWNTAQATWLYGRLSALTSDPATQGSPIFVFGHRPIPKTVWDGAQSSNPGLKSNLDAFPQVVYFSGHSHLNITDERSIHQDTFTSVNDGSMSYEESDSMFQSFGPGLAKEHTIASAQSVLVEVYGDRVEIDRIAYSAEDARTYTPEGKWSFQKNPPFASTGAVAGPTWIVARGADGAAIKAGFTHTPANRNTSAPVWGEAQPGVRTTTDGLVLTIPQPRDDQYVRSYGLSLTDLTLGAPAPFIPAADRIQAQYTELPRPAVLRVPLALRAGNKVGGAIDRTLENGHEYEATLTAYDSYGNASTPRVFRFVAGALDRAALDAAITAAQAAIGTVERVIGDAVPPQQADYDAVVADPAAARALVAQVRAALASAPAAPAAAPVAAPADAPADAASAAAAPAVTQDGIDAATAEIGSLTAQLRGVVGTVDRAPLAAAIEAAAPQVAKAANDSRPVAVALRAAADRATALRTTLNVAQGDLDAAAAALRTAAEGYAAAGPDSGTGGPGTPGTGGGTTGPGTKGPGTGANGSLAVTGAELPVLAVLAGLALAGLGTGIVLRRRRRAS